MWPVSSMIQTVPQFNWNTEKAFESLHYNTVNQTQLQFVRFTQVLISSLCFNTNHSYALLIHCSIQRDKWKHYKPNTVPINLNTGYNFFLLPPLLQRLLASHFLLWKHIIICNAFSYFAFSNLSPDLLLYAPLYTIIMCSSIALISLSLSRPNILIASTYRYFSTGHLAQEIHALLHIHCVICTTKTPTTSL